MQVVDGAGKHMEHHANVHRINHLAKEHRLVAEVEEHNDKSGGPMEFNSVAHLPITVYT